MKPTLTPRQNEVVRLVSLGCTIYEIADILELAVSTVDNHKLGAMKAFGTDKSTLLTRLAIKHKITSLDERLSPDEKRKCSQKDDGWN
jgi:DNA-binding NarL/FixJ family response regulator